MASVQYVIMTTDAARTQHKAYVGVEGRAVCGTLVTRRARGREIYKLRRCNRCKRMAPWSYRSV